MKKIYIYALLTITTTLATSCMKQGKQDQQESLTLYSQPGYTEPHWIYTTNQSSVTHVPVVSPYQPTQYDSYMNIPIIPMPLTHTIIIQPDQKIMQKLYDDAHTLLSNANGTVFSLYSDLFSRSLCKHGLYRPANHRLAQLIYALNKSKNDNIDANIMEQFAYTKHNSGNKNSIYIPFLFNFLKKYNIITHQTNESLPFQPDATESRLTQTFCVPVNNNEENLLHNNMTYAQRYPAFSDVLHKLCFLLVYCKELHTLASWMDSTKSITIDDYSTGTYTSLKMDFYDKTCTLLDKNKTIISDAPLYELVQIIEKAKNNNDLREYDFGKNILNLTPETSIRKILSPELPLINRQKAALFYALIQKYNTARGNKTTPTSTQCLVHLIAEQLGLLIPESLSSNLFNTNMYALNEFQQLKYDTFILLSSTENEIQENVDQIYSY